MNPTTAKHLTVRPAWLVAVAVLLLGGCSSGDGAAQDQRTSSTSTSTSTTTLPAPVPDQTKPAQSNGLAVDGESIWMTDFRSDLLLQIDRRTGAIVRRISTEGARADDVAVGPDGAVWTTGIVSGELGRFADGQFEKVAMIESGINGIEVAPDGTVYVATGGTLYRLPEGSTKVERLLDGLPDVNGFGILPDGRILAPGGGFGGPGKAVLIDPERKTSRVVVDDLAPVAAGTTDPDGTPYLLSNATGQLFRIDVAKRSAAKGELVSLGAPFDNLSFADDGTLYLSSFATGTITELPPGEPPRTLTVGS